MTQLLAEAFGIKKVVGSHIGIEVELEDVLIKNENWSKCWNWTGDGSLVNGQEAVSHVLNEKAIAPAVKLLFNSIESCEATGRCGIHVHCNVSDFTVDKLKSLLITYYMLEPLFFFVSGKRDFSCFCVGWNGKQISEILAVDTLDKFHRKVSNMFHKYDALNLRCTQNLGTVEFRMHKESNDPDVITKWAQGCAKFVDHFRTNEDSYGDLKSWLLSACGNSEYEQFVMLFSELTGYTFNDTEKQTLISAIRRRSILLRLSLSK